MARRRMNGSATSAIVIAEVDARVRAAALERVLQGDGVDDRGQHPHVIAGHAVDPLGGRGDAAEDVAAADDDGDLDAEFVHLDDLVGDARRASRDRCRSRGRP